MEPNIPEILNRQRCMQTEFPLSNETNDVTEGGSATRKTEEGGDKSIWKRRWNASARGCRFVGEWGCWLVVGGWLVGQIFRDAWQVTALGFYIPSPLVAVILFVRGVLYRRDARRGGQAFAMLLLPLASILLIENHWDDRRISTAGKEIRRIVHWNIYGSNFGITNILKSVEEQNPDLMVFSEVPRKVPDSRFFQQFPEGFSLQRYGGMLVLARGELKLESVPFLSKGTVGMVTWRDRRQSRKVMIVDLPSSILIARDPLLRELNGLIAEEQPDLVVGDLNAPRLSNQLCKLPNGYRHAYDAVGGGWSATWPVRLPLQSPFRRAIEGLMLLSLWSLDQCVVGGEVKPLSYELITTRYSDHRMQVLVIEE